MRKIIFRLLAAGISIAAGFSSIAIACTDFRITAQDGTVVIARSLEFAQDLKSNLRSSQRGRTVNTQTPDGKPALAWRAKYGYLFLDGLNVDATVDGMNEQGLSFEYLYLPGETEYQTAPAGQEKQALPYMQFGDWVLGNFKSVDEVRQELPKILVITQKLQGLGDTVFPLHAAIYDATGKGIVVEFVGGKMRIYDNTVGVMTNSPTYDWHITNLRNYVNLTPLSPKPVVASGITFVATGQGAGMLGLPGDVSPPSRFVKTYVLQQTAFPVADAPGAVNLAEHIINNVDIPLGLVREAKTGTATNELTQWVVFKDLTHRKFYFRSYGNMTLRAVSLGDVDFSENAPRFSMPVASNAYVQDVTAEFTKKAGEGTAPF